MAKDVRQLLDDFRNGRNQFASEAGEVVENFEKFCRAAEKEGALDHKTKELIGLSVALYARCEYCIIFHTYTALKHGATREEIMEAANETMIFGGGPVMAYISTVLIPSLDEFEKDFR